MGRLAAAAAMLCAARAAVATTYTWDVNGTAAGTGGTGNWDTTSLFWTPDGVNYSAWPTTGTANTAVFGGTAGTVTLAANISANGLNFNVSGYNFTNTGSGALVLNGTNPTINTGGYNASIGAGFLKLATGVTAFNKSGAGFLFLTGDNSGTLPAGTTLGIDSGTLNTTTGLYTSGIVVDSGRANGAAPTTYNLNAGSIVFNSSSALGFASSRTINVMAGGGALSDGGFVEGSANGAGSFVPNISVTSGATFDVVSSNNFAFDGGQGVISGAGGVTTYGTGTIQFLQANTYTGNLNISGGTVVVANTIANIGTASSLGAGSGNLVMTGTSGSQNTNNSGAYLVYSGTTAATTNRGLTLGGTTQNTINVSNGSASLTISGQVTDLGVSGSSPRFYKAGAGTLSFTYAGGNSFNGYKFLVDGGVLNFTTAGQTDQFSTDIIIGNQLSMAGTNPVLNLNGATLNIGNISGVGNGFGMCNGDTINNQVLTFNMSGGVLNTPTIYTNFNSNATGLQALMNISGGTINCSAGMYLQNIANSTTMITLSGSTTAFNVTGTTAVAPNGTGIINQSGGTLVSTGTLTLASGGTGTYNLSGGTVIVPAIVQTSGTGTLNLNGGTLQASAAGTTFVNGLTSVNVLAGGANINTSTFNDTINQPLLTGVPAGTDGGLTKTGTGALTLTGNNTYNGTTNVSAGTLVASTAGNGIGATTASLIVSGQLNLSGDNITVNKLTSNGGTGLTATTSANGDTLEFKVGSGTINTLNASTAVMTNATGIQIDTTTGSSISPGVYTLINSTGGGLTGSVVFAGGQNLTVPASQAIENIGGTNYRLTLASTGSAVTVNVAAAPAKVINIMPLGSSITAGSSAQSPYDGGGYRSQLYENLVNDGRFTPIFQGSQTANESNNPTGQDLIDAVGQSNHEGHPGYTTSNILGNLNTGGGWLNPGNGVNPDYVTLNIGGNDYVANPTDTTALTRLSTIIDDVSALRPNATIIVSSVLYRGDGGGAAGTGITTLYDPYIPAMVQQHVLAGEHVSFVDMYNLITPNNSLTYIGPDLIHPTQYGYDLMANYWYQSIATGQAFYTGNAGNAWNSVSGSTTSFAQDFSRDTDSGVVPSAGTDVYFNGVGGATTLGTNFAVRSVNFTAAATTPVTIGGGSTLTIGTGGITVQAGTGAHVISAPVNLAVPQTWATVANNPFTVSGNVSGTGPLTISGGGTTVLSGANTYTGGTLVVSGTLAAASAGALSTGPATLSNGATLALTNASATSVLAGFAGATPNTNGIFTPVVSATSVQLTNGAGHTAASVFTATPIAVADNASFTAMFTYSHTNLGTRGGPADGVAFVIQNQSSGALGGSGGALGYGLSTSGAPDTAGVAITPSVAAVLNEYYDTIGIGTNGTVPPVVPTNTAPGLSNTSSSTVTVIYNGAAQTLTETVTDTQGTYTSVLTNFDLATQLGEPGSATASGYFGFTGGSGGLTDTMTISNFSVTTPVTAAAAVNVTAPVAIAPAASAVLTLSPTANYSCGAVGPVTIGTGSRLTVSLGASAPGVARGILTLPSVTFASATNGTLDIGPNALDVTGQSLSSVTAEVASAYTFNTWQGPGITSSIAAADSTRLTSIGVIANNVGGSALYGAGTPAGLFDGISPGLNDVLVKYTYTGDANLDGKVDGSDYTLIDAGYLSNGALTGWYNGDFNYDGVVDGSDYALIDNAFNNQGAVLSSSTLVATETAQIAGATPAAVPEPAGLAAVCLIGTLLARRRNWNDATRQRLAPR